MVASETHGPDGEVSGNCSLAIVDEGFVEDPVRLGLDPVGPAALDAKTTALVRVRVLAALGRR